MSQRGTLGPTFGIPKTGTNGVSSPSSARNQGTVTDGASTPLSPIAIPSSLRPLNKGIKRTPSAGILSALAVAH